MNFITQIGVVEAHVGHLFVVEAHVGHLFRYGCPVSDATVSIGRDILRDRILLLLRSARGRFEARCVEAIEARSLDDSEEGAVRVVGDAIREASYAHAVYWESRVWC